MNGECPRMDAAAGRAMRSGKRGETLALELAEQYRVEGRQLERENSAMRWALENILARIDDDEWIPTEYVQQAREALKT